MSDDARRCADPYGTDPHRADQRGARGHRGHGQGGHGQGGHRHGVYGQAAPASGTASAAHRRRLLTSLAIIVVVLLAEVIGGLAAGSLALLADSGHVLTDGIGLMLALVAIQVAQRPTTPARTFGYYRVEIFAALFNAVLLGMITLAVLVAAVLRLHSPGDPSGGLMLGVSLGALVANAAGLLLLRSGKDDSLNVRGAYLEVLGDAAGALAAVVAAVVVLTTGWRRADAVASITIGVLIVPRAWLLLRDATNVLLEATPKGMDLEEVRHHIRGRPGVVDVHDVHAWTVTSGLPVLTAHVVVEDDVLRDGQAGRVLDGLHECLSGHFDIAHSTFQLEPVGHADHEGASHP